MVTRKKECTHCSHLDEEDVLSPEQSVFPEIPTSEAPVPDHNYHVRCANIRARRDFGAEVDSDAILNDTRTHAHLLT